MRLLGSRRGFCSKNHLNLNFRYPEFKNASEMYAHIRDLTKVGGDFTARNFVGVINDISPWKREECPQAWQTNWKIN